MAKKQKYNLDEAINALKNQPIPAGPSQQIIEATLSRLTRLAEQPQQEVPNNRIRIIERIKIE